MHTFTTKNPQRYCTLLFAMCMLAATFTPCTSAVAQDTLLPLLNRIYQIELTPRDGRKLDGYLKQVTDSTVVYTTNISPVGSPAMVSDKIVSYAGLVKVRLWRKGAEGRGALFGAVVGGGIGAVAGLASGDDEPRSGIRIFRPMTATEKAGGLAALSALPGFFIGALIGSKSQKFSIDGTKEGLAALQQWVHEKIYGKARLLND
jgi:hypothetical protein